MRKIKDISWTLFLILVGIHLAHSQLVISEIMYNPPEAGIDTLEFIELYNPTTETIALQNYRFTSGIFHTFFAGEIAPNDYYVIAIDSSAFFNTFNIKVDQWQLDGLRNNSEDIVLTNPSNVEIDRVSYSDTDGWPLEADGMGASLELCDAEAENQSSQNWKASIGQTGRVINGLSLRATPGINNSVTCDGAILQITEVLYTAPNGDQSNQFVEVYNSGNAAIDLRGYRFAGNVSGSFEDKILAPNEFVIGAVSPITYAAQGLSTVPITTNFEVNNTIEIIDNQEVVVTEFSFSTSTPWPTVDNESLTSIQICEINNTESDPNNWRAVIEGDINEPGQIGDCLYSIAELNQLTTQGESILKGSVITAIGIVHGINYSAQGLHFTIIDPSDHSGVAIIGSSNSLGFTPQEGDELQVTGTLVQLDGYTSIVPSTITILSGDNSLVVPVIIDQLVESNESQLVTINDVSLVSNTQWRKQAGGFEVEVTNGNSTFTIWIDDQTDIFNERGYPTGTFSVTGLVDQIDPSLPFTSGYRIVPRYIQDISPFVPFETDFPIYSIFELKEHNIDGVSTLLDINCAVTGIVYGVNLRPSGLQFTIIDDSHDGIAVFNTSENHGYTVTEGDQITVQGQVSQFNGLTQITSSNITVESVANDLLSPIPSVRLDELTESKLIELTELTFVDPSEWRGNGSSFSFFASDVNGSIFEVRIDGDVDIANSSRPAEPFNLVGIGSQFDSSLPYSDGYRIMPRYIQDIDSPNSLTEFSLDQVASIYPNPSGDYLNIESESEFEQIMIYTVTGRLIYNEAYKSKVDIRDFGPGAYILMVNHGKNTYHQLFIKE